MDSNFYFVPIIGTISSGKSTFLNGFLGFKRILQSGSVVTTKFVTLIKNSKNTSFYHVIPKKKKENLLFIKDGEELKDETEIKKKIEKINDSLIEKKGTKDDIFYVFETPIKTFSNFSKFENCYFMDIPGLNEKDTNYIGIIFSLINKKKYII